MPEVISGQIQEGMKYADLHMHSSRYLVHGRPHGQLSPQQLVEFAVNFNIGGLTMNAIALPEHNMIEPSLEARDYSQSQGYDLEVIPAIEVSSADGHVLALYVRGNIPARLSAEETLIAIHEQQGLGIIPHPFHHNASLGLNTMIRVLERNEQGIYVDGIEIYSAGLAIRSPEANDKAQAFYEAFDDQVGAMVGSSDAHFLVIGRGLTGFLGERVYDGIMSRQTVAIALSPEENIQARDLSRQMFDIQVDPRHKAYYAGMRHLDAIQGKV